MALAGPARRSPLLPLLLALGLLGCGAPKTREMPGQEKDRESTPTPELEAPSMWDPQPGAAAPTPEVPEGLAESFEEGQHVLGNADFWIRHSELRAHPDGHVLYATSSGSVMEIDPQSGRMISEADTRGNVDDMVFIDPGHAVVAHRDTSKVVHVSLLELETMGMLDERELDVVIRSGRPRLSQDGSLIATTSGEIPTRVWSVKTGKRLKSLGGRSFDHEDAIPIALAGGVQRVVGSTFGKLELYGDSLSDPIATHEWTDPELYLTPSGEQVIAVSRDQVHVMNSEDGKEVSSYSLSIDNATLSAVSPSGKRVLVAHRDGTAAIVDLPGGEITTLTLPNLGGLFSLTFLDEGRVATVSDTRALFVAPIADPEKARGPVGHGGRVRWLRFLAEDRLLSMGADQHYRLWDTASGDPMGVVGKGAIAIDPAGQWFATGRVEELEVRDRDGKALDAPPQLASLIGDDQDSSRREGLGRPRWWGDGSNATVLGGHDIHVVDDGGNVVQSWPFIADNTFEANPGLVAPSGQWAAMWDEGASLMLVDVKRKKASPRVGMAGCQAPRLAVFVDYGQGMRFVSLEAEGTFSEYDARSGKLLRTGSLVLPASIPELYDQQVQEVRAAADGKVYFTVRDQGLYRLDLTANTITLLLSRDDFRQDWSGLDISPSGNVVALGRTIDGTVEIWARQKLDARAGSTADLAIDDEIREACELIEPEPEPEELDDF